MATWNSARHNLDFLKDNSVVRFRVAYAADGGGVSKVDGFAFDDVWIGERQQNILAEYFTNINLNESEAINEYILGYEDRKSADLLPIHYHTGSPAGDPLFDYYSAGPSSRVFYYGVSEVPYVISNGRIGSALANGAGIAVFENSNDVESLKDPAISIHMEVDNSGATLALMALRDLSNERLNLFAAVVKDSVSIEDVYYDNILRKFVPDPGGISLATEGFAADQVINQQISFSGIKTSEFIGSKLIVFVQNIDTKQIYQSVSYDVSTLTSVGADNIGEIVDIYPNPVSDHIFIDCEYEIHRLVIMDITGRIVIVEEPFSNSLTIPVYEFKNGLYIIRGTTKVGDFTGKFVKR
jgi:hypothetical protein